MQPALNHDVLQKQSMLLHLDMAAENSRQLHKVAIFRPLDI